MSRPDRSFDRYGLGPVSADQIAVHEVLTYEIPGHAVEKQLTGGNCLLLIRRQHGDDEAVADVDVELVP
jgi:hypothetical protein